MLLSIELWNRTKTFSVDIKYMPSIYVCLSFCLCRPCHFFTALIAFLRVIQYSLYCSSLFFYSSFSAYTLNCTEGVLYILTYFKIMSYAGRLLKFIHKTNPYKSLSLKNKICKYPEGCNFA